MEHVYKTARGAIGATFTNAMEHPLKILEVSFSFEVLFRLLCLKDDFSMSENRHIEFSKRGHI